MAMKEVDHAWVHPEDRARFVDALETVGAPASTGWTRRCASARGDGGYRWVRSHRAGRDGWPTAR
jgi:hypothetical protein